jgi:hypothetical protein
VQRDGVIGGKRQRDKGGLHYLPMSVRIVPGLELFDPGEGCNGQRIVVSGLRERPYTSPPSLNPPCLLLVCHCGLVRKMLSVVLRSFRI